MYFCLYWIFGAVYGLFSSCGAQASQHVVSLVMEPRLCSCDTRAYSMWGLPRPGIKTVSVALAGGFLTTRPPGKPYNILLSIILLHFAQHPWVISL